MTVLEARGVAKSFRGQVAVGPVDLEVREGEQLALTGPSGSGKTTLLRLLAGLVDPSCGEVRQRGLVVSRPGWQLAPHLRGLGMLFQDLALWPHMTVRQQVEFSLSPGAKGGRLERRRLVAERLERLGLAELAQRYPAELSGGERQRVAWARAVTGEPGVLLLDEPLTSLDPQLKDELLEAIVEYTREPGRTVVLATHDPRLATRAATRVLRLAAGRALE